MPKLKVLMVISQFSPIVGGAEKQAQLLSKKLVEKGVEIQIVTGWWKWGTPRKEIIDGVPVFRNFSFWGMFGIKGLRPLGALTYMITLAIYLLLHRSKYDIIHVHQALYPAFVSVLLGEKVLKKPGVVKTASSGMASDIKQLKQFPSGSFQLKYLIRNMGCLVTVSNVGGQEFKEIGYPESRIIYLPNGVSFPTHGKENTSQMNQVLTTARLSIEKGIDFLLKTWVNVVRQKKGLKLIILGDGPLFSEMQEMSHYLGIDEEVEFLGKVNNVEEHLSKTDLFILPSRTEGMSNALLEAMSYGVPCIATNVGGNSELLGGGEKDIPLGDYFIGKNGLLVNPDDIEGLSKAILYLVHNPEKREELGRKARQFIQQNYSIDLIAEKYITLYKQLLNRKF